jgi:2-keto-4-pentenoate hydratase/2-oxohepta-3-ene-1,7-dioic acid hydratase in catechol pathway
MDWEVELAFVIGRRARWVSAANALDYVFGYMVLNDVSARDLQADFGGQFFYGKSLDGSCPIGPWIVTADEIPDPQSLALKLRVNGQTKQDGRTRDMIYAVDALVEWVSRGMTLPIASIIATGTPDGVGFARKPPEFLRPGDVMETEVEGIGVLHNRIIGVPND